MSEQSPATVIRQRAEALCPWDESSPLRAKWLCGYLEGALGNALQSVEALSELNRELAAERDGWKDTAECRKPNPTLLKL